MQIRKTTPEDLDDVMRVYAFARSVMAESGNPTQWGTTEPRQEVVEADIAAGKSYVCMQDDEIAAVFYFAVEDDPYYAEIEGPGWLNDEPYGVLHRIAASGAAKGAGRFCIQWAFEQCGNMRIDTHMDNAIMRHVLAKMGFQECGTITTYDGTPRLAFQKVA